MGRAPLVFARRGYQAILNYEGDTESADDGGKRLFGAVLGRGHPVLRACKPLGGTGDAVIVFAMRGSQLGKPLADGIKALTDLLNAPFWRLWPGVHVSIMTRTAARERRAEPRVVLQFRPACHMLVDNMLLTNIWRAA